MTDKLTKKQLESLLKLQPDALEKNNPHPAWWEVVKGLQLAPYSIIPWIIKRLEDQDMVRAFVTHPPEGRDFISSLEKEIHNEKNLREPFRRAWEFILCAAKNRPSHEFEQLEPWFSFQDRIKNNDYGHEVRKGIVNAISPRLKVGISWKRLEEEIEGKQEEQPQTIALSDLMHPEFETNHFIHARDILKFWQPEDKELTFKLCRDLTNRMVEKLEFAKENDLEWSAVLDVPSIELHEQNSDHASDFYPIVRLTVDLWERLDKDAAIKIANMWNDNRKLILMHRMYLHALTKKTLYRGIQAANELLSLGDDFWGHGKRKEIATLLQKRWRDFTENRLEKLEKKILAGPPRKLYLDDLSEKDWKKRKELEILKKLRAVSIEGGRPSPKVQKIFDKLKKKYPDLPEWQTEFDSYHQSFSGEQGDPALLEEIPTANRIDKALELQNQSFEQHDVWRKYCLSNPKGAFEALKTKAKNNEWPEWAWQQFFWGSEDWKQFNLDNKSDRNLIADALETIKSIPERNLEPFVDSASFWMREIMHLFDEEQKLCLWHKLMAALEHRDKKNDKQRNRADPFTDAINRAEGRLTEMVFSWWKQRGENEGFEEKIAPLMERLVKCKNYSGALIRTTMMPRLDYLYYIDPKWTEKNILSELKEESPMWWPLWDGYKYNNYFPRPELFNEMKKALLEVITASSAEMPSDKNNYLISYSSPEQEIKNRLTWLLVLVLFSERIHDEPYELTQKEMKQILREVDDETRQSILGDLRFHLREKAREDKIKFINRFFEEIWPLDAKFIDESVLSEMISLITDMGDAFPQSLDEVKDFLHPKRSEYYLYTLAYKTDGEIYLPEEFPEGVLELLNLTIDNQTPHVRGLNKVLDTIKQSKPELESDHRFRKLRNFNS